MDYLQYGLLGDKLVHINDVEKGKDCNCLCPHCKAPLIAKTKNENRKKHFAHYRLTDCNHGTETALHLMAKNIVAQSRKVYVPYVPQTEYDFSKRGTVMTFENAVLEKQLSATVRGDVVLHSGDRCLNVEIKVTHEVDLQKMVELFNLGIPTIEVDLSDIKATFTPEMIEQRLLHGENIKLINSPKSKAVFAKLILGEWKKVHKTSYGTYVKDCPISRNKTYFFDYYRRGGFCQCHECYCSYTSYNWSAEAFLCLGCLDSIDFSKIERILDLEKEDGHIRKVKLLMNDGSVVERNTKLNPEPQHISVPNTTKLIAAGHRYVSSGQIIDASELEDFLSKHEPYRVVKVGARNNPNDAHGRLCPDPHQKPYIQEGVCTLGCYCCIAMVEEDGKKFICCKNPLPKGQQYDAKIFHKIE